MLRTLLLMYCAGLSLSFAMDPTLAKGQTRVKLSFDGDEADSYFNHEELAQALNLSNRPADYSEDAYSLEVTYGLTNDMALIVRTDSLSRSLSSSVEEASQSGVSGYYLALRQAIAVGQGSRIYSETGVRVHESHDAPLPLSPGGTSWYALFSYNQDFLPSKAGFNMDLGYVFGGGAEDELVFGTDLVLDFLRVVDLSLEYDVVESKKDKKVDYAPLEWPGERGYQQAGLTLHRNLGRSFQASLGYHTKFKGRNQYETDGFSLSISWWFARSPY